MAASDSPPLPPGNATGLPPLAPETLLCAGILVAAVGVCAPALGLLPALWARSEFYAHGYAIPAVALYLLWNNRGRIAAALRSLEPPALGPIAVLGATCVEALFVLGDVGFAAGIGIPLVLGAALFAAGGTTLVRPCAAPLAFLTLMVPPPRFLIYALLFRLKLLVTDISVWLLHATGRPVTAEGNQILTPGHTLFVADACSGLTSIITLLPLACIAAYFLCHGVWRRALVIASVVPLALAANVVRILVTVELVQARGVEYAQGLLHEGFGLTTYVLGTLAVLGVARLLR